MAYSIGTAVSTMWTMCRVWSLGYGQGPGLGGRWDLVDGGAGDCSSTVARSVNRGYGKTVLAEDGTTYTGTLRAKLLALGWSDLGTSVRPRQGDVVLARTATVGHVAMMTDDSTLCEAWINELGKILGGARGDQTGQETRSIAYSAHPYTINGVWTNILRPPADSTLNDASGGLSVADINTIMNEIKVRTMAVDGNLSARITSVNQDFINRINYVVNLVNNRSDKTDKSVADLGARLTEVERKIAVIEDKTIKSNNEIGRIARQATVVAAVPAETVAVTTEPVQVK